MRAFITGFIVGGICVSIPLGLKMLHASHHYKEYDSTLVGSLGNDKIQNIAFFDYTGYRLMELNKWKVLMTTGYGDSIILYQRQSAFQERIPHRPVIEIEKDGIWVEDGEYRIRMIIEKTKPTEPNQPLQTTTRSSTNSAISHESDYTQNSMRVVSDR